MAVTTQRAPTTQAGATRSGQAPITAPVAPGSRPELRGKSYDEQIQMLTPAGQDAGGGPGGGGVAGVTTPTTDAATASGGAPTTTTPAPVVGTGGVRRMWTAAVPIPGTTETMYLGKWYYDQVSESQEASYQSHATTSGGWFEITKTQFEIQHGATDKNGNETRKADPNAWTFAVRGPGGAIVKTTKMNFTDATQVGDQTFWATDQTGTEFEVRFTSPLTADCDATVLALDKNGGVRTVDTLHFKAGQTVLRSAYVIQPGEALHIEMSVADQPSWEAYSVVKTTAGSGGGKLCSNIGLYGNEAPTATDVQDALNARKGR